jgi:hypothetical protein
MKIIKNLFFTGLALLAITLAACKDDAGGGDPVDPAYQKTFTASDSSSGGYDYTRIVLGPDSAVCTKSDDSTETLTGLSTGGGGSEANGRWDYIYKDGVKGGIVMAGSDGTNSGVMILLGQAAKDAPLATWNIDAVVSDIPSGVPNFYGTGGN